MAVLPFFPSIPLTILPYPLNPNNNPPPWVALLLAASGPCCRRSPACPPRVEAHHRPATRDPTTPGLQRPPTNCSSNPVTAATADRADGTPNNLLLLILSILLLLVSSHRASQLPTNRPNNQQDPNKRTKQHKQTQPQTQRKGLPAFPACLTQSSHGSSNLREARRGLAHTHTHQ